MNTKPEVSTIGDAMSVIEVIVQKPPVMPIDPVIRPVANPAYDLDE